MGSINAETPSMTSKPSYTELENKITALEKEIESLKGFTAAITRSESRLKEAEELAHLGHWELDLTTNTLYWSDEIYRIFELDPGEFGATYEAFLETVHPDDKGMVNRAFQSSVKNKTGYDLVHRLLLKDGRIKYVHEKCRTIYSLEGQALRSLGTVQDITDRMAQGHRFSGIVGRNAKMQELFETIRLVTDVDLPVLIQGESGTGKELVAKAIHNEGPRAGNHFVPVNCGALPEGLLESELFGHVKGAFTGAIRDRKGRFEMAHGGTLFLDEIADMPKSVQVKLLRVLQDGKFERVGSEKTVKANARIISAANRDLKKEVAKGNFREDLYYRISVIPVELPPLRQRQDDIPLLIDNFMSNLSREGQHNKGISRDALANMVDYHWPGNIRELQSTLQYALIKSKGRNIQRHHLPMELQQRTTKKPSRGPSRKLDVQRVQDALTRSGGNKAKAARLLGVGRATLYRFLSDYPDLG
jgi:PAS domain S-box-containing protein